jgi:hypothetical protein
MRRNLPVLLPVVLALCLFPYFAPAAVGQDSTQVYIEDKGQPETVGIIGPAYCQAEHDIGRLVLGITNFGRIGRANEYPNSDFFTGLKYYNCQYPKGSQTNYLWKGGLWLGAIVGRDTLVSCATDVNNSAREFSPEPPPGGNMTRRSTSHPEWSDYANAVSEQDFVGYATDTLVPGARYPSFDAMDGRGHRPLPVALTQKSYAWSYDYADDFVLFDWSIRNIGQKPLKSVYVGLYMDIDVHLDRLNPYAQQSDIPGKIITEGRDDITGFLFSYPATYQQCNFVDTLKVAWAADNDGDPLYNGTIQVPNVVGVRFLGDLAANPNTSYNWWVWNYNPSLDFGPQTRKHFRYMGGGIGTPVGDRNKYAMMSNGEVDYDQMFGGTIPANDATWMTSDLGLMYSLSRGGDNAFCLAVGPYDIGPGQSMSIPWAFVGGENFHTWEYNYMTYVRFRYNPRNFYDSLDFSPLAKNAEWASWIYDNPGVDTDSDGYAGKFRVCVLDSSLVDGRWVPNVAETTYYEGDGVADFRGAAPPPPPYVWVYPATNALRVRFNGEKSETARDVFSGIADFEGYRVYMSRDDRESSYSLVASYDRENYDKWVYNRKLKPQAGYELKGIPATIGDLRCAYGQGPDPCADSSFDPLSYSATHPFLQPLFPDSVIYFTKHDYNASRFGVNTPIRKTYPDAPVPSVPPAASDLTDDGLLKYYEYEMTIDNLLPTVPYYVNVTAFDFGAPGSSLAPLETSKTNGSKSAYPIGPHDTLDGEKKVYIYPNPYRVDDPYRQKGYEGRARQDRPNDRVRQINFANLPAKCTIRIYTLDGDLVRQLDHNYDASDPNASHDTWDMITRNTQMIVSGIYYWCVEDETGKVQIGKLIVIM